MNAEAPGVMYVGGEFLDAGGNPDADHIATWSGDAWGSLGPSGLNGAVRAIAQHSGTVFVGGGFTNAGGHPDADFLAAWDGVSWKPFCNSTGPAFGGEVLALEVIGSRLYVGGTFQNGAGIATADYLVVCDLNTGAASSTVPADGSFSGPIYALAADGSGTLYAGGRFNNLADIPEADNVAYLDGSWHALGSGVAPSYAAVDGFVRSISTLGTNVYVGTEATDIASLPNADHVARWNGSAWNAMGSNALADDGWFPAAADIKAVTTSGSVVFAAGEFENADADAYADRVAFFDGNAWHHLGSNGAGEGPLNDTALALAVFDQELIAGGNFTDAGGDPNADFVAAMTIASRPDARIGTTRAGPFIGGGVYSSTGAGEVQKVAVQRGRQRTLFVGLHNEGVKAGTFTVKGTGRAEGYTVTYFRGKTDVTSKVKSGTFATSRLGPGSSSTLKMVVRLSRKSANVASFLVTARGGPSDAVRLKVTAK